MGETSITCGNCGTVNDPDAKYCRECGALLAAYASPAGSGPMDAAVLAPTATDDALDDAFDATAPIEPTAAVSDPRPPLADTSARDPDRAPVPAEVGTGATDPPSFSPWSDETPPTTATPSGSTEPTAEPVAAEAPAAEETTPTLTGTLGSGALGPIGTAPSTSSPMGATATGSPLPADASPTLDVRAAERDLLSRSDAGRSEPGVEDAGSFAGAPPTASHSAPASSGAPGAAPPDRVSTAAWTEPEAPLTDPPPTTSTSMFGGGFGASDRFSTVATTPPRTILTVGGVLILASCVILAADLPGYLTLLSLCAGPVGFILLIVGGVMLLSQRPERRF